MLRTGVAAFVRPVGWYVGVCNGPTTQNWEWPHNFCRFSTLENYMTRARMPVLRNPYQLFAQILALQHADESPRRVFKAHFNGFLIFELALAEPLRELP